MNVNSKTIWLCVFLAFTTLALIYSTSATSFAASTTVKVQTNKTSFPVGISTILVSGNVSPAPGYANSYVAVTIISPTGALADANQFPVNSSTGAFNGTFVTGGPTYNSYGTYTIKAIYNNASGTTTFVYGSNVTTTTSTTSTSSTISVSSPTTSSSSVSSTTSTTSVVPQTSTSSSSSSSASIATATTSVHPGTTSSSSSTALTTNYLWVVLAFVVIGTTTLLLRRKT